MKVNKRSEDYLRTEKTFESYATRDGGTECIRKLYINGSEERVGDESGWLKGHLLP